MKSFGQQALLGLLLITAGCGEGLPEAASDFETRDFAQHQDALSDPRWEIPGELLFRRGEFGGNGRTCETCHGMETGTVSPAEVQARFNANPEEPLFRALDSDDGSGQSYNRLLNNATVLVRIPLAPNVRLLSNPSATHAVVARGIPSTLDTPALDPILMVDGREPSLESQALGAILSHAEAGREPPPVMLKMIARFEKTLFSSAALRQYAEGGPAPVLPEGTTDAEKRGRIFFQPDKACGACHFGPMLNEIPPGNMFGFTPGRFARAFVSELNPGQRPVQKFLWTQPNGVVRTISSPDPGRFLLTGQLLDWNLFKIPSLWNVNRTAPYFHDNSAATLEAVMSQYDGFFKVLNFQMTPQEKEDVVAYLKLL